MRRLLTSAAVFGALLSPALVVAQAAPSAPAPVAAAHTDFSGTWLIDSAQSQAPMPLPQNMTMTVTQTRDSLKIDRAATTPMGDVKSSVSLMLDGTPTKNTSTQMGMSVESSTTASWDGPALVAKTTADVGGNSLEQTDRWSLSADGKQLTIDSTVSAGGQMMSLKLVMNRK